MSKLHKMADRHYAFHCPGCKNAHGLPVNGNRGENGSGWQWNGSMDLPTFQPSILCRSTEMTEIGRSQYDAWMRGECECPEHLESRDTICHSFVTDGKIQFLADCTHALAGQTVDIPEWE